MKKANEWVRTGLGVVCVAAVGLGVSIAGADGPRVEVSGVAAGSASFESQGSTLVIQAADKTIINYRQFDVPVGTGVQFVQPGETARVLNRIQSAGPSLIDGMLTANGIVYFVNPAGVLFGPNAVVNVHRLYAAAGNIRDEDFLSGVDRFAATGAVVNQGRIQGSYVALIGREVGNSGLILAPAGTVVMAAGEEVYLGAREGRIFVRMDSVPGEPQRPGIENTGRVEAEGGRVEMAAGDLYSLAIRQAGMVRAAEVSVKGEGGSVQVSGVIDASNAAGTGGDVEVSGRYVAVTGTIDASGADGGGSVSVGGGFRGQGPVANAETTYIAKEAVIRADGGSGAGGTVVIWSDRATAVSGVISAKGDAGGGLVETSSAGWLWVSGAQVRAGQWLLDPTDIAIREESTSGGTWDPLTGVFTPEAVDTAVLNVADVIAALEAGTSVTVDTTSAGGGTGNITLEAALAPVLDVGAVTLSLSAESAFTSTAAIQASGSYGLTVNIGAGAGVNIGAAVNTNGGDFVVSADGDVVNSAAITTGGGAVQISSSGGLVRIGAGIDSSGAGGGGVRISGTGIELGADVTAGGGVVEFDGPVTLTADVTVANSGGTGVRFNSTVNGAFALVVNTAGTTQFDGAVGGTTALTSLTTDVGGTTVIGGGLVQSVGGQVYGDAVVLGADTILQSTGNGDVELNGGVDGGYALVVMTGGTTRLGGAVGGTETLASLTTDAGGATVIGGGLVRTSEGQFYGDAVELVADTELVGSGVTFQGTVDAGEYDLTITADGIEFWGGDGSVSGSGQLVLQPGTVDASITIGSPGGVSAGTLDISDADWAALAEGFAGITIGRADGGHVIVVGSLTAVDPLTIRTPEGGEIQIVEPIEAQERLTLESGGSVTQSAGIRAAGLELRGEGPFVLDHTDNAIEKLAGQVEGEIQLRNSGALEIARVGDSEGLNSSADVTLVLEGKLSQSAKVVAEALMVKTLSDDGAAIILDRADNDVAKIELRSRDAGDTATAGGDVVYMDKDAYEVEGIETLGNATLYGFGDEPVRQNGAITAGGLRLTGTAVFELTDAGNDVDVLAFNTTSDVRFVDVDDLAIGAVTTVFNDGSENTVRGWRTTGGTVEVEVGGDLVAATTSDTIDTTSATAGGDVRIQVGGNVSLAGAITSRGKSGGAGGEVRIEAGGDVTVMGAINTSAETSAAGGDVTIEAGGQVNLTGAITSSGGTSSSGDGGAGGTVRITGTSVTVGAITTSGGTSSAAAGRGGDAGDIYLTAMGVDPVVTLNGSLLARAGAASSGNHGEGGIIDIRFGTSTSGTLNVGAGVILNDNARPRSPADATVILGRSDAAPAAEGEAAEIDFTVTINTGGEDLTFGGWEVLTVLGSLTINLMNATNDAAGDVYLPADVNVAGDLHIVADVPGMTPEGGRGTVYLTRRWLREEGDPYSGPSVVVLGDLTIDAGALGLRSGYPGLRPVIVRGGTYGGSVGAGWLQNAGIIASVQRMSDGDRADFARYLHRFEGGEAIVVDVDVRGTPDVDVATIFANPLPRESAADRVLAETGVDAATAEMLREILEGARAPTAEQLIRWFYDLPQTIDDLEGGATWLRFPGRLVRAAVNVFVGLYYQVDPVTGDRVGVKAGEVRRKLRDAVQGYLASKGASQVEDVEELWRGLDRRAEEAGDYVMRLNRLFRLLRYMGLTAYERARVERFLMEQFMPENLSEEQFRQLIERAGPRPVRGGEVAMSGGGDAGAGVRVR